VTADSIAAFLAMGGYGWYVWPSYAIVFGVIIGLAVRAIGEHRRWTRRIAELEAARDRSGS
jgi:heme exporter protein D